MTADAPPPVTAPVACVDRAEARTYVAAVKERAYDRWTPSPEDPAGNAAIRFRLDEQGQLLSAEMVSTTSDGVARSAKKRCRLGADRRHKRRARPTPWRTEARSSRRLGSVKASRTIKTTELTVPVTVYCIGTPSDERGAETSNNKKAAGMRMTPVSRVRAKSQAKFVSALPARERGRRSRPAPTRDDQVQLG